MFKNWGYFEWANLYEKVWKTIERLFFFVLGGLAGFGVGWLIFVVRR